MYAPIEGAQIYGDFAFVGEANPLPADATERCAERINDRVLGNAVLSRAVWFNPISDGEQATMDRVPLIVDGRPVRYIGQDEMLVIAPAEQRMSA